MGVSTIREHVLDPAVVHAMAVAYDECAGVLLRGAQDKIVASTVRTKIALTVIELAERGVRDPAELRDVALARLTMFRKASERRERVDGTAGRDAAE